MKIVWLYDVTEKDICLISADVNSLIGFCFICFVRWLMGYKNKGVSEVGTKTWLGGVVLSEHIWIGASRHQQGQCRQIS